MFEQERKIKYASLVICHYGLLDDFGEKAAPANHRQRNLLVQNLIQSLKDNTDYPCEIIVMDNGGNPDVTDWFVEQVRKGVITQLVRSHDNLHFAMAWNLGAKLATGDYLSFVCNDIEVQPGWLSSCVKILEDYPDRKFVATPFITYGKRNQTVEITKEGYRVNLRSGSNCMVMRKEDWPKLGEFPVHRVGGTLWYTKNVRADWRFVAPPKDLAIDRGARQGVNFGIPIEVKKTLLNGEQIHFEEKQI